MRNCRYEIKKQNEEGKWVLKEYCNKPCHGDLCSEHKKKIQRKKGPIKFCKYCKKETSSKYKMCTNCVKKHYEEYLILKSKEKSKKESPEVEPPKSPEVESPKPPEVEPTKPPKVELHRETYKEKPPIEKIIHTVENKLIPEEKIPEITPKERSPYDNFKMTQIQSDFIKNDMEAMDSRSYTYHPQKQRKSSYFNPFSYFY